MDQIKNSPIRRIAVIGTHLPRQCGIGTFTTDFCEAIAAQFPDADVFAVAINDTSDGYAYPSRVRFEIAEGDIESYRQAADFLNINAVDLVVLQHEYGIFGGPAGSYALELLSELRMPIVTVLHTVLREPDRNQRTVLSEIARLSDRLVVMSHHACDLLREVYQAPTEKIAYIPHGIPDVPFVDPNFYKDQFDAEGKVVLLTFGLLSANKGIEYVIAAMPTILKRYPNVLYMVLGATHPHVRRQDGEAYRLMLQRLAREKGVERNIVFYNQFVRLEELVKFIGATDLYITPYLNPEQIVSGTLAYTVGTGKAVISTPYLHAEELLGEGRGMLVPFRDSAAIAEQVIHLLDNDAERHAMRKRAYTLGRDMTWPQVAQQYLSLFRQILDERLLSSPAASAARREQRARGLPPINLGHLRRMTDSTGLLQHATFSIPNYREGYSTDDNARALIAAIFLEELEAETPEEARELAARYLAFLLYAFNEEAGRFRNMLSFDRHWLEEVGSEDSHGRALWSLGTVVGCSEDMGLASLANTLFARALPAVRTFTSPRAWAFALLGIHEYLKRFVGDRGTRQILEELAERLMRTYEEHSTADWLWFEDILAYDNATLPRALLVAGHDMKHAGYTEVAIAALTWLTKIQSGENGVFVPIGCHGFHRRGEGRARFDQQPVEAQATVAACLDAYRVTGDGRWRAHARDVFDWFIGHNDLRLSLVDPATGACYDGLQPSGVNQNQGAESTLAFLLSLLDHRLMEEELSGKEAAQEAVRLLAAKVAGSHA